MVLFTVPGVIENGSKTVLLRVGLLSPNQYFCELLKLEQVDNIALWNLEWNGEKLREAGKSIRVLSKTPK
jgi:hypothetical protein